MKRNALACALLAAGLLCGGAQADNLDRLVAGCESCHGKDGASADGDMPNIGGLSANYIAATMQHYRSRERPCVETRIRAGAEKDGRSDMCRVVKALGDDDIAQLARHYSARKFVRAVQPFDAAQAARGRRIHARNCEKCHSGEAARAEDDMGILAGQKTAYLREQMDFYAAGERWMHKKMRPQIKGLGKNDVESLLHYYASLQ